jgi:hypothetical protein
MIRKIFKYELETVGKQTVKVQELTGRNFDDQILKVEVQNGKLCMWCLVDDDEKTRSVERKIFIFETGQPLPSFVSKFNYIGSYLLPDGVSSNHVFTEK